MALPELPAGVYGQDRRLFDTLDRNLPHREVLQAANKLNRMRYNTLSFKQRLFVDEYLMSGFDPIAAARAAKFVTDEDNDNVARKTGEALLRKPYIQAVLDAALDYYKEKRNLKLDDIVDELKAIAFSNVGDFFKPTGEDNTPMLVMPSPDDPRNRQLLSAVSEITVSTAKIGGGKNAQEIVNTKFKMHSKLTALDQLMKIMNVKGIVSEAAAAPVTNLSIGTINIVAVPRGHFFKHEDESKQLELTATELTPEPVKELPMKPAWAVPISVGAG